MVTTMYWCLLVEEEEMGVEREKCRGKVKMAEYRKIGGTAARHEAGKSGKLHA